MKLYMYNISVFYLSGFTYQCASKPNGFRAGVYLVSAKSGLSQLLFRPRKLQN